MRLISHIEKIQNNVRLFEAMRTQTCAQKYVTSCKKLLSK